MLQPFAVVNYSLSRDPSILTLQSGVRLQTSSDLNSAFLTCIQDNVEGGAGVIALECCDDCLVQRLQVCGSDGEYWIFGWAIRRTCRCPGALWWTRRTLNSMYFWTRQFSNQPLLPMCITARRTDNPFCVLPSYHTRTDARERPFPSFRGRDHNDSHKKISHWM